MDIYNVYILDPFGRGLGAPEVGIECLLPDWSCPGTGLWRRRDAQTLLYLEYLGDEIGTALAHVTPDLAPPTVRGRKGMSITM